MRITFLVLFLLVSCTTFKKREIRDYHSWHYQLQDYQNDLDNDLWDEEKIFVVDPDEIVNTPLLKRMKKKGVVLAYLSIGEAEDYRDYFKTLSKDLLLYENKNWKGNFKVKYWDPRWQEIIFKKVTALKEAGYDGFYLDIVDAFYELKPQKLRASQMRDFLRELRRHVESKVLIQQNAPTLFEYLPEGEREEYFSLVNGIAYEDCFFYGKKEMDNPYNPQDYCLESMKEFEKRDKLLLSVEYISEKQKLNGYKARAQSIPSLLPLTTNRGLRGPHTLQ